MADKKNIKYTLLILTLLFASLLQVDWPLLVGLPQKPGINNNLKNELNVVPAKDFLLKQYDNAVKEIQERLDQESTLFALKFSLVGAILGMMFTSAIISIKNSDKLDKTCGDRPLIFNPLLVAMFCWGATITCAVVDTRIMYHIDIINMLGVWIKTHAEPVLYGSTEIVGWERFLSNPKMLFHLPVYPLIRSDTSVLTFLLFLSNTIVFSSNSLLSYLQGVKIFRQLCIISSIVCFFIFFLISIHFRYNLEIVKVPWIIICLFIAIFGALCSYMYWRLCFCQPDKTDEDLESDSR